MSEAGGAPNPLTLSLSKGERAYTEPLNVRLP
jgi:hypothetical protein